MCVCVHYDNVIMDKADMLVLESNRACAGYTLQATCALQ